MIQFDSISNHKYPITLIALLSSALIISTCTQPAAPPGPVVKATEEINLPTEIPAEEPQSTAAEAHIESGFFTYIGDE